MVRYLFYTIGDLTYQSPLVHCLPGLRASKGPCLWLRCLVVGLLPRKPPIHPRSWWTKWQWDTIFVSVFCRSQWSRDLRSASAAARLLGLWVRIPPRAWMFVSCECLLSGRSLLPGVVSLEGDREASIRGDHGPRANRNATKKSVFLFRCYFTIPTFTILLLLSEGEAGEAFKATIFRNWVYRQEKYFHSFIIQMGKGITLIITFGFQLVHLGGARWRSG